jgi:hypothetical protein
MLTSIAFSVLYLLGAFNHYISVKSILYLTETEGSEGKIMLGSAIWPYHAIETILQMMFDKDEDNE